MPDDVDRGLLERFVQGDQAAFESLFRQFEREVYGGLFRITRDSAAAEDAVVETFWRALSEPRAIRSVAKLRRLDAADRHQRRARSLENSSKRGTGAAAEYEGTAMTGAASHELRDSIRVAFGKLPPRLAAVAGLALIEDRPYAEIAEALDVPIGTVKSRVFRATRLLREELAKLGVTS
jgi:RNA polymerase sigma-70 factor (ECF subfamily)